MGEVVGTELGFEAVRGGFPGFQSHDASIVDEYIQRLTLRFEFLGGLADLVIVNLYLLIHGEISDARF